MNIRRLLGLFICLSLLLTALSSCDIEFSDILSGNTTDPSKITEPEKQARSFYEYFNTVCVVISYKGDSAEEFDVNCNEISALLDDYHKLFDIYYEYAGVNNLMTINKNAGIAPVKVDERLIDFLLYAKEIYDLTEGKTNVAMGSVLSLWHHEREWGIDDPENAELPDPAALEEAAKHTDINCVIIDETENTVYLSDPNMSLDVGALGKGYATEKAAELLMAKGVTSYVLNFGGNIRAIGTKVNGDGWLTGITNPDKESEESFVCKVNIKDISLVTSGDYERYYIVDGVKYHHIIDPKTNMPAKYFSSISIFTEDSGLADALSTALFCMSYEDGLALINKIGGVDAIWVTFSGEVKSTGGIEIIYN